MADIGIHSTATGMMIQMALDGRLPLAVFMDNSNDPYKLDDRVLEGAIRTRDIERITYCGEEEGIRKLTEYVRDFLD